LPRGLFGAPAFLQFHGWLLAGWSNYQTAFQRCFPNSIACPPNIAFPQRLAASARLPPPPRALCPNCPSRRLHSGMASTMPASIRMNALRPACTLPGQDMNTSPVLPSLILRSTPLLHSCPLAYQPISWRRGSSLVRQRRQLPKPRHCLPTPAAPYLCAARRSTFTPAANSVPRQKTATAALLAFRRRRGGLLCAGCY